MLGIIVFWNLLEISKTIIIKPSVEGISMVIQRDLIHSTVAYETANSPHSIIYDPSVYFL